MKLISTILNVVLVCILDTIMIKNVIRQRPSDLLCLGYYNIEYIIGIKVKNCNYNWLSYS